MTQQEVAAMALPYMEKDNGKYLDQGNWTSAKILPEEDPFLCGTTLCSAGWVAHLLGHIVRTSGYAREFEDGMDGLHVEQIAQEALELTNRQADFLFYGADNETALRCFGEMADGLGFPSDVITWGDPEC